MTATSDATATARRAHVAAQPRRVFADTERCLRAPGGVVGTQIQARATEPLRVPLRWPTPRNRRFAETRDPEGERPLSEREIRDQALIFLIAGHTTTSNALCSTLHLLGRHPEIQQRVAATEDDELARAAVQEGLRLHPPSYVLGRRVGAGGAAVAGRVLAPGTDVLDADYPTTQLSSLRPSGPVWIACHPR